MARFSASSWWSWSCSELRTLIVGSFVVCAGCCSLHAASANAPRAMVRRVRMATPSFAVTNADARGCSLGALDGLVGRLAARQGHAHPAMAEGPGLGEDAQVDGAARRSRRKRFEHAFVGEILAIAVGHDDGRSRGANELDRGNRQAEDRAQVQLELV